MRAILLPSLVLMLSACDGSIVNTQIPTPDDTGDAEGAPNIYVEITNVEFGSVGLGSTGSASINIQNNGVSTLTVEDITSDNSVFTATAGAGLQVAPGLTTSVGLKFLPTAYGEYTGTLTIVTDDPDEPEVTLTLSGSVITDSDADGYDSTEAGGDDCDDSDDSVYPGAADEWYDGTDSNCDGVDDFDQDGDGYQTDVYNADPLNGGGDCQDNNPDIYPGAPDEWYDGVDSDCDGSEDNDFDGDGFDSAANGTGNDCDDMDADIHPDADEKFNRIDDDCDGEIDGTVPGWNSDLTYYGANASDEAGYALTMGDLDGDGFDELIVGSAGQDYGRGAVTIYTSSSLDSDGSDVEDGENYFRGSGSEDSLGTELSWLENFSDGGVHLAVGAPGANSNYGAVYVIPGADLVSNGDTGDAVVTVTGSGYYHVGRTLTHHIDLDGDGLNDLMGSTTSSSSSSSAQPYQWLLYGDAYGEYAIDEVDAIFYVSDGSGDEMMRSYAEAGDVDGDGRDDFVFCDPMPDIDEQNDGALWVLWGKGGQYNTGGSADSLTDHADLIASGDQFERFGTLCTVGDDIDGDGDHEIWVFNPGTAILTVIAGGPHLRDGEIDLEADAVASYEFSTSDPSPVHIRRIGDWNGDGQSEIGVSLEANSTAGQVRVFDGTLTGELSASGDAFGTIKGDDEDPYFQVIYGSGLSTRPGDLNADGLDDLVVGDPSWGDSSSGDTKTGAVYITFQVEE